MPDLQSATRPNGKTFTRRREFKRRDGSFECEMIQHHSTMKVCQYCSSIIIYCQKKVAAWSEIEARNIFAVRKWEGVGFITEGLYVSKMLQRNTTVKLVQKVNFYWPT
jgi:hypothetical protein